MSRLIDADALKDWECEKCESEYRAFPHCRDGCGVMQRIDDSPTVDAVEVVRCKECKYSKESNGKLVVGARYCTLAFSDTLNELYAVWDVDFCADGKRRGEEDA